MRPLGDVLLDIEPLLEELIDEHDLQKGDVLALINVWIDVHRPCCKEEYQDGSRPVFKYGPQR